MLSVTDPQIPDRVTPEQAATLIAEYRGERASPEHVELVRALVTRVASDRFRVIPNLLAAVGGLAYWCEQQGQSVTADRLTDIDLIDICVQDGLAKRTRSTRRTDRSELRRVASAHHGRLVTDRRELDRRDLADRLKPYTPEEVDGLLTWARA